MQPDVEREYVEFVQGQALALRRTAYRLCGDWHLAEDLVQSALIRLYRHWGLVTKAAAPDAYVRKVVVNAVLEDRRRWWTRRVRPMAAPVEPGCPTPGIDVDGRLDPQDALASLPDRQRCAATVTVVDVACWSIPSLSRSPTGGCFHGIGTRSTDANLPRGGWREGEPMMKRVNGSWRRLAAACGLAIAAREYRMTVRTSRSNAATCAFAVVSAILVVTGCTTNAPTTRRSEGGSIFTDGPASSPGTAAASGSAEADPTKSRCHNVQVTEHSAPSRLSSPGHVTRWLVMKNSSGQRCTLFGFAEVSYVSPDQLRPVNDPARHDGSTPSLVWVEPEHNARVVVTTSPLETFPSDTCKPVPVIGYQVNLPEESTPALVPARGQQCSAKGVNVATVSPIQPGD